MINDIIVIGDLEAALYRDQEGPKAVRLDGRGEVIDCQREIQWLFNTPAEKRYLAQSVADLPALQGTLQQWSENHYLLKCLVTGIDSYYSQHTRQLSIAAAAAIFAATEAQATKAAASAKASRRYPHSNPALAVKFARHRLLGTAVSDQADLAGGIRLAAQQPAILAVYQQLADCKPYIPAVLADLTTVLTNPVTSAGAKPHSAVVKGGKHAKGRHKASKHQPSPALNQTTEPNAIDGDIRDFIDEGIVADTSLALANNNIGSLNNLLFSHSQFRQQTQFRAFHQQIKQHYFDVNGGSKAKKANDTIATMLAQDQAIAQQAAAEQGDGQDPIELLINQWLQQAHKPRRAPVQLDAAAKLKKVQQQKQHLIDQLLAGHENLYQKELLSLVRFQYDTAELSHLCKTLCDLAAVLTRQHYSSQALALYRYAQLSQSQDAVAYNGYAETLSSLGRFDEALAAYEAAKQRFSHNAVAHNGYAETLRSLGRFDEALATYEAAKQQFSHNEVAHNGYAATLRSLGRFDEALAAYQAAKQLFSHDEVAVCGYAATLRSLGRFDEALAAYEAAKQRFSHNEVAVCGYAETLRSLGRFDEALATYEAAKQQFSHNEVAHNGYADTLRSLGRFDEALAAYQAAKQQFSHDAVAVCGYAETLRSLGRNDEALAAYEAAKQQFSHDEVAVCGYAETLRSLGRFDEALAAYQDAKQQFSHNEVAVCGYAATLRSLGRFDEALAAYQDAKQRFSHNAVANNGYAETLRSLGRFDEALAAYQAAKQQFSHDAVAHNGYADTLRSLGRFDEALAAYQAAKQRFSHDVVAVCGYAATLRSLGRNDEALAAYEAAKQRFSHDAVVNNGLACVLIETGDYDAAKVLLKQQGWQTEHDWRDLHVLAMLYVKTAQFEDARRLFTEGINQCPLRRSKAFFKAGINLVRNHLRDFASILAEVETFDKIQLPIDQLLIAKALAESQRWSKADQLLTSFTDSHPYDRAIKAQFTARYAGTDLPAEQKASLDLQINQGMERYLLQMAA